MTTLDLLIGHTGFVGGALAKQRGFDVLANSSNINDMRGRHFRRVVNAGVTAVKWMANKDPEADRDGIKALMEVLDTMSAECFIQVSTVDVYGEPRGFDEFDLPERAGLHPYGLHRLELEDFVRSRFDTCHVARLPALFGPGLKKNAIYDLMNNHMVEQINPATVMQWYPLERLGDDLDIIVSNEIDLVNLVTEPVSLQTVVDRFFPTAPVGAGDASAPVYDLRTRYSEAFGGVGDYVMSADDELAALDRYLASEA